MRASASRLMLITMQTDALRTHQIPASFKRCSSSKWSWTAQGPSKMRGPTGWNMVERCAEWVATSQLHAGFPPFSSLAYAFSGSVASVHLSVATRATSTETGLYHRLTGKISLTTLQGPSQQAIKADTSHFARCCCTWCCPLSHLFSTFQYGPGAGHRCVKLEDAACARTGFLPSKRLQFFRTCQGALRRNYFPLPTFLLRA